MLLQKTGARQRTMDYLLTNILFSLNHTLDLHIIQYISSIILRFSHAIQQQSSLPNFCLLGSTLNFCSLAAQMIFQPCFAFKIQEKYIWWLFNCFSLQNSRFYNKNFILISHETVLIYSKLRQLEQKKSSKPQGLKKNRPNRKLFFTYCLKNTIKKILDTRYLYKILCVHTKQDPLDCYCHRLKFRAWVYINQSSTGTYIEQKLLLKGGRGMSAKYRVEL
eukprot:TRINITY_DN18336_c0_g1_i1.p1 TRINITY_DN18336_c0_g1~~TRINITY_DN18336_c0_g1_i1.p1  ORF type:complete len:248 (-),score=-20.67 TRINITY_DN18336_c0_g1_i1:26-685(-)